MQRECLSSPKCLHEERDGDQQGGDGGCDVAASFALNGCRCRGGGSHGSVRHGGGGGGGGGGGRSHGGGGRVYKDIEGVEPEVRERCTLMIV